MPEFEATSGPISLFREAGQRKRSQGFFHKVNYETSMCKRNIEMTPLCKIEVTHPRVLGSREVRRGGVVDEQTGVQPS